MDHKNVYSNFEAILSRNGNNVRKLNLLKNTFNPENVIVSITDNNFNDEKVNEFNLFVKEFIWLICSIFNYEKPTGYYSYRQVEIYYELNHAISHVSVYFHLKDKRRLITLSYQELDLLFQIKAELSKAAHMLIKSIPYKSSSKSTQNKIIEKQRVILDDSTQYKILDTSPKQQQYTTSLDEESMDLDNEPSYDVCG